MISFRQHVVTLVAVFLALAVGVVLGGGPLSDLGRAAPAAQTTSRGSDDAAQAARAEAAYADAVLAGAAGKLYAGALADTGVALVTFPGVPDAELAAVTAQVEAAGGSVTTTWAIQPALVDPGERALVDTLGSQLATQADGRVGDGVPTYERIGELLGLAAGTTRARSDQGGALGASVTDSLKTAELVLPGDAEARRAPLVLVLLGTDSGADEDVIYAGVVAGLSRHARATVLAAGAGDPRLGRLRDQAVAADVATVDSVDTTAGQVTAVLALVHWPETKGRSFGASGADGAVDVQ